MNGTVEMTAKEFVAKLNSLTKDEINQIGKTTEPKALALQVRETLTNQWLDKLKRCPELGSEGITIYHSFPYNQFYFEKIKDMGFVVKANIANNGDFVTRIELI